MGYTTDFIGHFEIRPALNAAERDYLDAFAESRRWARPGGPYAVPDHPGLEEASGDAVARENVDRPPAGAPGLWCQWLVYLIDHFLRPDAKARADGGDQIIEFTFDHRVDGVVAACRRDTRRLWTIEARDNDVSEQDLVTGLDEWGTWGAFPYEEEIDRYSRRRRPRVGSLGAVVRPGRV